MKPTIVTDFKHNPKWLDDLAEGLERYQGDFRPIRLWVRDKQIETASLPIKRLREISTEYMIDLQWSLTHRCAAQPNEWIHIPDDEALRSARSSRCESRILSVHSLAEGERLLERFPRDQILLSPWAKSISKTGIQKHLDQDQTIQLSGRFPGRIHLISGLVPSDEAALRAHHFTSLCFLGALSRDLATFLEQLQAHAPQA